MQTTVTPTTQTEIFINMALAAWDSQNNRVAKLLNTYNDEQWASETAPGRNRGIYLIGHLIAVSDGLFPLFGLGQRRYPDFEKIFLTNPDRAVEELPSIAELKTIWVAVHDELSQKFKKLSTDDWFSRHTSVSEEDFAKEPHRNKLNVLMNRTGHTAYHLGQLVYLAKKS